MNDPAWLRQLMAREDRQAPRTAEADRLAEWERELRRNPAAGTGPDELMQSDILEFGLFASDR